VLIHEGRLTYQRDGLSLVEDLGTSFEQASGAPVPLGGILARLSLPADVPGRLTAVLQDSIAYGWANREETLATIQRYAQELEEDVIWPYVELYVNDHTVDFGADGENAIATLEMQGARAGILAGGLRAVRIFEPVRA
jgi:1,4-dihydroxy-6-naphthoate synthase